MQGIRKYEIFGESIAGKNKDIRVGSLQFSTLQVQLYYKDSASNTFPKMLSTLTGKFEKCVKILNEELPHFKARSVYSHWKRAGQSVGQFQFAIWESEAY